MKLWANVYDHENGATVELAETFEDAEQLAAAWVRKWWWDVFDKDWADDQPPEDDTFARELYFERSEEGHDIVETQLPFPVVLVVHDHAAYMELTDVLGVEPFPYYNAQGEPHWAVFTEVDYRMEYIIDVDVPALRKLLTPLFERRVFGVIVVGNA
jgi:hypothetical protein